MFAGKKTIYIKEKLEAMRYKLAIEEFAIWMAISLIAGTIAKCEFKTFINGKENKGDEYYLWNIEPNANQNKYEFIQELVAKFLFKNECLVVGVSDQLIIADSFNRKRYAIYPDIFSDVSRYDFNFERNFSAQDTMYFASNYQDIRMLLSRLFSGYSDLLDMAVKKYKSNGGRKGILRIDKTASGDKEFQSKIDDLFLNRFKSYFENQNAVVHLPKGFEYNEIPGEGSKKSTSDITDISGITMEAMTRVAQAFRIPSALLQGDIAGTYDVVSDFITFCIEAHTGMIETEINRKRYGKKAYTSGTCLKIDTTKIRSVDIFKIGASASQLVSSALYSPDEMRKKIGEQPINKWWSQQYYMTKNFGEINTIIDEGEKNEQQNRDS